MASFNERIGETIREGVCLVLGVPGNFEDYLSQYVVARFNPARPLLDTAYRNLCNREPPPEPEPEYTGGQCPVGYYYAVTYEYNTVASGEPVWNPGTKSNYSGFPVIGPMGNFYHDTDTLYWATGNPDNPIIIASVGGGRPFNEKIRNWEVVSLNRADGAPDSCGDPPPIIPPPAPQYNDIDAPFTYIDNSGNEVDIDLNFTFGSPLVDFDGELNIPIRINFPDVNIPINGNLTVNKPEFNFNFGDSNYPPTRSPNGSDYDTPTDTPDPPPDVPDPVQPPDPTNPGVETVRSIKAVLVTVTDIGNSASLITQGDNPDIYIPNLGYVQFLCQIGSRAGWTSDIAVKNRRNLIQCPWEGGAIAVRGTPRSGVSWVLTEVYAKEQQTVTFEV